MSTNLPLPIEIKNLILSTVVRDRFSRQIVASVSSHFRGEIYRETFCDILLDDLRVTTFLDLVSSSFSSTAILPRIRNLVLRITPSWTDQARQALDTLLALLSLSSKIHTFSISCDTYAILGGFLSGRASDQLSTFPSVNTLKLRGLAFCRSEDLENLFSSFPNGMHIELQSVVCNWETSDNSHLQLPGEFSVQFSMEGSHQHQKIVHWQLAEPICTLKSNQVAALTRITNNVVSSSLQSLGLSLRHLSVCFHRCDYQSNDPFSCSSTNLQNWLIPHNYDLLLAISPNDILQAFNLSSTPKIRGLSLGSSRHVLSLMPWVPVILYSLSKSESSTLTTLEIVYASSRQIHLDRTFLRCLSFALSEPSFKVLQTVHFIGYQDNPCDVSVQQIVRDQIKSVLRMWDEKNMLRFSFHKLICGRSLRGGTSSSSSPNLGQRERENMWFS